MKKTVFKSKKILAVLLVMAVIIAAVAVLASAEEEQIPGFVFNRYDDNDAEYQYPDATYTVEKRFEKIPETVSAWVYVPSSLKSSEVGAIIGNTEGRLSESGIDFVIGAGAVPTISIQNKYKGTNKLHYDVKFESKDAMVPTDAWSYVTFVYDNASGIASCYINGEFAESKYFYPVIDDEVLVNGFVFGGDNRELNHGYFKGGLGDVTLYSDVRTSAEIKSDYEKGREITKEQLDLDNVIAYYDVDENDIGKDITDDSGNGYNVVCEKTWLTEAEMEAFRTSYGFSPSYSFAIVGDTQKITRFYPQNLPAIYDYIVKNIDDENIKYSIGLGDITDKSGRPEGGSFVFVENENEPGGGHFERNSAGTFNEWDVAYHSITLMDGHLEYSLIAGNHDNGNDFDIYFAPDKDYTSQFVNHGGIYGYDTLTANTSIKSVNNTWRTFAVGNVKYLIMNIAYNADSNVLAWANEVLSRAEHKDHNVIITTHAYLDCDGTALDSGDINCGTKNSGAYLWENLVSKHENVKMMLAGHVDVDRIVYSQRKGDKGNTVTQILVNAQGIDLRIKAPSMVSMFYFSEDGQSLAIEYYSTVRGLYLKEPKVINLVADAEVIEEDTGWMGNSIAPGGSGSEDDPYLISNGGNLLWMAEQIVMGGSASVDGMYFEQTQDIDLNGNSIYSIGYYFGGQSDMAAFGGHYDGNGYSIKNGTVQPAARGYESSVKYGYGLFGVIFGATVENVVLENIEIVGAGLTGGIVGRAASPMASNVDFALFNIISGCEIKDTVKFVLNDITTLSTLGFDNASRGGRFGSICGMAHNTVIDTCTSAASIKFSGNYGIGGGIVGSFGLNSTVSNSAFTGKMTLVDNKATQTCMFGGIAGMISPTSATYWGADYAGYAHITNCYNSGNLDFEVDSTDKNTHWAGILGGANYIPYVAPTEAVPYAYLIDGCYNLSKGPTKKTRSGSVYAGITAKNATDTKKDASTLYIKDCHSVALTIVGGDTGTNEYRYVSGSTTKDGYDAVKVLEAVGTVDTDSANASAALIDADILAARAGELSVIWYSGKGKPTFTPMSIDVKYYDSDSSFYYTYDGSEWKISGGEETSYGIIPDSYTDVNAYPFVIFKNGEFKGAGDAWNTSKTEGVIANAIALASDKNDVVTVVLRRDYTHTQDTVPNIYNQLVGTLNIDLGNKTVTTSKAMVQFNHKAANNTVNINMYNGKFTLTNSALAYLMNQSATVRQDLALSFKDITFIYPSTAIIATSDNTTGLCLADIVFENCTFDLSTHSNAFILINASGDASKSHLTHVVFKGGEFISKVDFSGKLMNYATGYANGEADTLKFERNENNEYTKFVVPSNGVTSISGELYDSKNLTLVSSTVGDKTTYQFVENCVEGIGTINSKYYDVEKYPFLIYKNGVNVEFESNFESQGKQDSWIDIIPLAVSLATDKDDAVTVVLRRDYTNPASTTPNAYNNLVGSLNIDLGGYTLTTGRELVQFNHKLSNSPVNVNFKNGTILVNARRLVNLMNQSATVNQVLNLTFSSVTIDYRSNWSIINGADNNDGANGCGVANVVFENSTIDLTNYTGSAFNLITKEKSTPRLNTSQVTHVVFKGGEIKANVDFSGKLFGRQTDLGDTLKFERASDGSYTKFTFKSVAGTPSELYDSEPGKLEYILFNEADGWVTYTLKENENTGYVKTDYGYIPEENANDPFVLFQYGKFVASYATWNEFNVAMGTLTDTSKEANTVILVRQNHTTSSSSATFHNVKYLTIDLGGNQIIGSKGKLFNLSSVGDVDFEANIVIKNGTLSSSHSTNPPITFNSSNKKEVAAKFNVTFEGVTFTAESTSRKNQLVLTAFSDGTFGCTYEMTFNNCTFDATNGSITGLFGMADASGNKFDINVTVNGGTLKAKEYFALATFSPERVDGEGSPDSLTFGKDNFSIILPNAAVAPGNNDVYTTEDGTELVFVKASSDATHTTYKLMPKATVSIDFTPKTSITLGSELVYNVYVPVTDILKSFTVDGKTYENLEPVTLDDGKEYYLVSVNLPASTAAKNVVLKATVTVDGKDYGGTWTMSIPNYAKTVIESSGSEKEVTLVKDVLAYIKAAYIYFDSEGREEAIKTIDEILGDYNRAFAKSEGVTNTESGLWGVLIVLDKNPYIRFILPEGVTADNYTFKSGTTTLAFKTGAMTINSKTYNYAEVSLYAYQLIKEITYSNGINSGSYHINSYYDFITTDAELKNDVNLISLVEKLYNYCKSAEAYRASVTE